jgi:hypothetical protein
VASSSRRAPSMILDDLAQLWAAQESLSMSEIGDRLGISRSVIAATPVSPRGRGQSLRRSRPALRLSRLSLRRFRSRRISCWSTCRGTVVGGRRAWRWMADIYSAACPRPSAARIASGITTPFRASALCSRLLRFTRLQRADQLPHHVGLRPTCRSRVARQEPEFALRHPNVEHFFVHTPLCHVAISTTM